MVQTLLLLFAHAETDPLCPFGPSCEKGGGIGPPMKLPPLPVDTVSGGHGQWGGLPRPLALMYQSVMPRSGVSGMFCVERNVAWLSLKACCRYLASGAVFYWLKCVVLSVSSMLNRWDHGESVLREFGLYDVRCDVVISAAGDVNKVKPVSHLC